MGLIDKINFGTEQPVAACVTADKPKLSSEEVNPIVDMLIESNESMLKLFNEAYAQFPNTDLGSVINRLELNAIQLKQIKDA